MHICKTLVFISVLAIAGCKKEEPYSPPPAFVRLEIEGVERNIPDCSAAFPYEARYNDTSIYLQAFCHPGGSGVFSTNGTNFGIFINGVQDGTYTLDAKNRAWFLWDKRYETDTAHTGTITIKTHAYQEKAYGRYDEYIEGEFSFTGIHRDALNGQTKTMTFSKGTFRMNKRKD